VTQIHPTAIVDPRAELGQNVIVGPFCIVEAGVVIGEGCRLEARAIIKSRTTLGRDNEVGEGTILGGRAQHVQAQEPGGTLVIGDGNRIRENATIHRGWKNESVTIVGNNCMIMTNTHIGHDARIGNHCILVNNVMIAGHVVIEDRAFMAGACGVHQFNRVGKLAMVGGMAKIKRDVPPYVLIDGSMEAEVVGLNKVGLRRSGYTPEDMLQLKAAYRVIYREGRRWNEVLEILQTSFSTGPAAAFYEFMKTGQRGFVQERRISRKATLKLIDPADDDIAEDRERDAA
jgi:UDP-N-acetylglucosamine acyltransferase